MGRWKVSPPGVPHLTAREAEVLALYAVGLTNKGIARKLSISFRTVDNLMIRAKDRLEARTITQAVAIALHAGIIQYDPVLAQKEYEDNWEPSSPGAAPVVGSSGSKPRP